MKKALILSLVFCLIAVAASAGLYDKIEVPVVSEKTTAPSGQVTETFNVPETVVDTIATEKAAGKTEVNLNLGTHGY